MTQKQTKLGYNLVDKENKKEVGKGIQGEDNEMDIVMGTEDDDVGMKRRARTPLTEISNNGLTGKRPKVEERF